ncbi:MAG: NAD(+)/NADH kinase [Chitinophagaceae bacterium]|nr:NAD(+)/NADH kinase [Chitinophagaceae bacterium]
MSVEYAIIIKNKTRLETLIERFNTKAQAKFYIEHSGGDFSDYEKEDENFHHSLSTVQRNLSTILKNKIVERSFLPSFIFNDKQVIITVGQDGLVANTAKYVGQIPIVAVNPDQERFDGVLLPFNVNNFLEAVDKVINNKYHSKLTSFAEATLNDGQRLLAFNDLFIGAASHVSARYQLTFNNKTEEQSSSGIIVSTQAGSTGWLSSIFNMSFGISKFMEKGGSKKKLARLDDDQLMFAVREPFASKRTQIETTAGFIGGQSKLIIQSLMPNNGLIFSDGIETDFLKFNSGSIATIGIAQEKANLVTL